MGGVGRRQGTNKAGQSVLLVSCAMRSQSTKTVSRPAQYLGQSLKNLTSEYLDRRWLLFLSTSLTNTFVFSKGSIALRESMTE